MNSIFNKIYILILVLLVIAGVSLSKGKIFGYDYLNSNDRNEESAGFTLQDVKVLFPDATHYTNDADKYAVYNPQNDIIGYMFSSSPYSDSIKGYGGATPLLIGLDNQMQVSGIRLLKNYETPEYINSLSTKGFFESWSGLQVHEAIVKDVDGLSGATITSYAIANTVRHRLQEYSAGPVVVAGINNTSRIKHIAGFFLVLFALLHYWYPRVFRKTRLLLLTMNVLLLGIWLATMLSLSKMHTLIVNGCSLRSDFLVLVILVLSVLLPLIKRKDFYCSYLCPFGSCQQLIHKANIKNKKGYGKLNEALKYIRIAFLSVILVLLVFGFDINLSLTEPFSLFNYQMASPVVLVIAVVFLALSFFYPGVWCKVCPTGKVLSVIQLKSNIKNKKNYRT